MAVAVTLFLHLPISLIYGGGGVGAAEESEKEEDIVQYKSIVRSV